MAESNKDTKQENKDAEKHECSCGKKHKVENALKKSPINYFSDLFIVAMVLVWIIVIIIMVSMAIYATTVLCDVYMWSDIANLVSVPLSCGGAIWMIKNSVQHAIANNQGKEAKMDFPKVNADGEDDGFEQAVVNNDSGRPEHAPGGDAPEENVPIEDVSIENTEESGEALG